MLASESSSGGASANGHDEEGDNGGMSHNRFQNKGNDLLRRKRQSNMRNIGYGISTSVKPKKLHMTYDDY